MSTKQSATAKDPLRERAAQIVSTLRAGLAYRAEAERLNQEDSDRLQRLADEVASREAKLDAEDLDHVADVENRKRQLVALRTKYERESRGRLQVANDRANAIIGAANVREFWQQAHSEHKERLMRLLTPEFHFESQAVYTVNNFPSSERYRWWIQEGSSIPTTALMERLEKFINKELPLWRI